MKRVLFDKSSNEVAAKDLNHNSNGIIIAFSDKGKPEYKLHRVSGNEFAWIDLNTSRCWGMGTGSFSEQLTSLKSQNVIHYDSFEEFLKYNR
jgi:hypothetical protein